VYRWDVSECRFDDVYESEKYDSRVYDEHTVCRWTDVRNERAVYGVCTWNGMCNVSDVDTVLGRRGMYGVPERPVLERDGVYGMCSVRRWNIRIDGVYGDDEPRM